MKLILVALDDSPNAQHIFDGARELAERTGARLLLAHVVTIPIGLPAEAWALEPTAVEKLLIENAERALDRFAGQLSPERFGGKRVVVGVPWRSICALAKSESVDLVAIGSHGYHGLDRVLGTTAAKVVNHADRSVLVIRAIKLLDELLEK